MQRSETLPTVLMVDGDELSRSRAAEYLRQRGFTVLETDGSALSASGFETLPQVDILFSRVVLPAGKSGFELAMSVRNRRPGIKVILATTEAMVAHKTYHLCEEYLGKHFR